MPSTSVVAALTAPAVPTVQPSGPKVFICGLTSNTSPKGTARLLNGLIMAVINRYFPGIRENGKGLFFLSIMSETKTPGGLGAQPVLTSYYVQA